MKIFKEKKWGINLEDVKCPQCEEQMPQTRIPETLHQILWGGWTCSVCGCKMDKWGNPVTESKKQQEG